MSTIGTLFAVSLEMSLKEEQTLQRLFKPHVLKESICLWRHVGATSRGQTRESMVTIDCAACSDFAVHGKKAKPHTEE